MKKKILHLIPYIMGAAYLIYCLFQVDSWVESHIEEYLFFVMVAWIFAAIITIVLIALRFITKKKYKFYLPLFPESHWKYIPEHLLLHFHKQNSDVPSPSQKLFSLT